MARYAKKLEYSDLVSVIAPSRSLSLVDKEVQKIALERFNNLGLEVQFEQNVNKIELFDTASIKDRVDDIHSAFKNPKVIGRFHEKSNMTDKLLQQIIKNKKALNKMPIVANIDFGHTYPISILPIGNDIRLFTSQYNKNYIDIWFRPN